MQSEEFNEIVERRVSRIKEILQHKAKEYATDDRLHNFHVAARVMGTTPKKALHGMMMKHIVSVFDMIEGILEPTSYLVDEKIGDTINYLILLEAMLLQECEDYNGVLYRD